MGMDLSKMIGYKFFKNNDAGDVEEFIRISKYYKFGNDETLKIVNLKTKEDKVISPRELKEYTPLKPDGVIMFMGVEVEGNDDVITSAYLLNKMESGDTRPFCICRQCITDLYYNLIIHDESQMIAGMSMNILNIPQGFDYGYMMISDKLLFSNNYMIYKDDTVQELLEFFKEDIKDYDNLLENSYLKYCQECNPEALFGDEDKGWCRNLLKLLSNNNFQSDLDEMFGITTVEFEIEPYLIETKTTDDSDNSYLTITDELKDWLSYLYKLNIGKVYALPFDHDIEFEDLKRARYFIFRDSIQKLYVFVYTIAGEYKEAELEEKANQLDFSTKFRINFLDKYKNYKNINKEVNIDYLDYKNDL